MSSNVGRVTRRDELGRLCFTNAIDLRSDRERDGLKGGGASNQHRRRLTEWNCATVEEIS